MSEDNNNFYLTIKDLFNETLIRDLVIFSFLFLLVITQIWENITLLLFPLVTFAFSIFFRIININKWRTEFKDPIIVYNPLGLEKKHANRLFFTALFQLILIFWLGAESLYNPHIIDGYFLYFNTIFIFLYTFSYFWIFVDLWKHSKIETIFDGLNHKENKALDSILSYLNIKHFRLIVIINFSIFIVLNILNFILILTLNQIPFLKIQLNLPGTGSAGSDPLAISSIIYLIFIISPLFAGISLVLNYREVNNFSRKDLEKILKPLPNDIQIVIIENLKALNNKIRDQLNIE